MQETQVQSLGWEDTLGGGNGNPLQNSCLENFMDTEAWWTIVHGTAKSRTWLSDQAHTWALSKENTVQFSSVAQSCQTLQPSRLQHTRLTCPSPTPGAYSNSCSLHWVSDVIQPSHPLSSPSPPAFNLYKHQGLFFASGSQRIGASASASVLPVNIQDWFPSGLTGWLSLLCEGLSRVFSNTTVQKHQLFGNQLSLWSNPHIHTWLL